MKSFQSIFRIGIFLPYAENALPTWKALRNHLRQNGFISSFLVSDYLTEPYFSDKREKSFFFLNDCHVAFFVIEEDVGKGGFVSELEEYKREVYPREGKKVVLFEKCSNLGEKLKEDPSSVIIPNLTEEKFHIRRFLNRNELPNMSLGAANVIFYNRFLQPHRMLDPPTYRLKCQICSDNQSDYLCINRCRIDCENYHVCEECLQRNPNEFTQSCLDSENSLYSLPPFF